MPTSIATVAQAYKAAMRDAIETLVDTSAVLVAFGSPAPGDLRTWPDIVAVTRIEVEQAPAGVSPQRPREETIRLTVVISCWRAGGAEQEQVASAAAYAILEAIERHVRVTDTTLGGVVRHCFLDGHVSDGETDPEALANGRTIEIEATFTAAVRITG